ncbi:sialate O-acetylesterase [Ohtaekwangia kribbensis]|uniref:Sialate O-acetylesterase n=1 Tax=Ohtaekwangia kribbensis TaxID=688913 RepID=A0ABW3K525_9BACT
MLRIIVILSFLIIVTTGGTYAQRITMPAFFSSNMVLQRQKPVAFWGSAPAKASFAVTFNGRKQKVKADANGQWRVLYPAMEAGGPYTFTVHADSSFTFTNILLGDVWICSGQSNMEWPMLKTFNASYELRHASYPEIRSFTVERNVASSPLRDTAPASWQVCTPQQAAAFTAVGYFFARELYQQLNVPIGIIHSSWGGTSIEAWTSGDALSKHPDFRGKVDTFRLAVKQQRSVETLEKRNTHVNTQYWQDLQKRDRGFTEAWYSIKDADSQWTEFIAPDFGGDHVFVHYSGSIWLRKTFRLTKDIVSRDLVLNLETLNDYDITYCNGIEIGRNITWAPARRIYIVPKVILKPGENTIVMRLDHQPGNGLFRTHDPADLRLYELIQSDDAIAIPLEGAWAYRFGLPLKEYPAKPVLSPVASQVSVLYNGMIAPFTGLGIKGFTWYQGESNAGRAYQYRSLLPLMITDWRAQFQQGDVPFLIVQTSAHGKLTEQPVDNTWAELREAQAMALTLPNTAMAVSHDVGDPYDVHPTQKQVVGKRLALEALKVAYGRSDLYTSPRYQSCEIKGDTVIIYFTNTNGLQVRGTQLKGFSIAGTDQKFVWADAVIRGDNTVYVYSKEVQDPVAVRYGWAGSPVESNGANLYSIDGFPAMSFRTDVWDGITLNKK